MTARRAYLVALIRVVWTAFLIGLEELLRRVRRSDQLGPRTARLALSMELARTRRKHPQSVDNSGVKVNVTTRQPEPPTIHLNLHTARIPPRRIRY